MFPLNPYESLYAGIRPAPQPKPELSPIPIPEQEEESLLKRIGSRALSGLGYLGAVLDKTFGGRAVRGLLGGNAREALSLIPLSDTFGITDPSQIVYGRQLLEKAGIAGPNEEGLDAGDLGGFLAEVALDPAMYINPFQWTKFGREWAKQGTKTMPVGLAEKMRGASYAEKQLAELPAVKAGLYTAESAVPSGSSVIPAAVEDAARQAGIDVAPRLTRAAEAVPVPVTPGQRPFPQPPPATQPYTAAAPSFDEAVSALQQGNRPAAGTRYKATPEPFNYQTLTVTSKPNEALLDAARLTDQATGAGTPLIGLAGIGLPFGLNKLFGIEPLVVGTGAKSQKIAEAFDAVGGWLKGTAPVRYLRANLSYPTHRAIEGRSQGLAESVLTPEQDRVMSEVLGQGYDLRKQFEALGGRDPEEVARLVARASEGVPLPPSFAEYSAELARRDPVRFKELTESGKLGEMADLFGPQSPVAAIGERLGHGYRRMLQSEQAVGGKTPALNDVVDYAMRQRLAQPWEQPQGFLARIKEMLGGTTNASQGARLELFRGFPEGTTQINDLIKWRTLDSAAGPAGPIGPRPVLTGKDALLTPLEKEALIRHELTRPAGSARINPLDPADMARLPAKSAVTPEVAKQAEELAGYLGRLDPRYALEGRNYFDADFLSNFVMRGARSARTQAGAKTALEAVGRHATPLAQAGEPLVPVPELLRRVGLADDALPLATERLGLAKQGHLAKDYGVPEALVGDLTRWLQPYTMPAEIAPVLRNYDKALALFKGWVTRPFPAFHVRNLGTGVYNMIARDEIPLSGAWESGSDAKKILQGRADFGPLPGAAAGLSPLEARDALLREAVSRGVGFTHSGQAADIAGGTAADIARLATETPGKVRMGLDELAPRIGQAAAQGPGVPVQEILARAGLDTPSARARIAQELGVADLNGLAVPAERLSEVVGRTAVESLGNFARGLKPEPGGLGAAFNPFNVPGVREGPAANANILMRAGNEVANTSENWMRLTHYLAKRRQGFSPEAAAQAVEKYHFDYGRLADFEKSVMKRLMPFYAFGRKNLPAVAEDLAFRPGTLAPYIRAGTGGLGREDFVPPYLQEQTGIPLGASAQGYSRFISSLGLPYEDEFVKAAGALLGGDLNRAFGNFAGNINPLLKLPIEEASGVQLHSGRRLEDLRPTGTASLLAGFNEEYARPLSQILSATPASRAITTIDKLVDTLPEGRKTVPETALNLLTGIRLTDVDVPRQKETTARNVLQEYLRGKPGVQRFEKLYVKPEKLPLLSEDEFRFYSLYKQLEKEALLAALARKKVSP